MSQSINIALLTPLHGTSVMPLRVSVLAKLGRKSENRKISKSFSLI